MPGLSCSEVTDSGTKGLETSRLDSGHPSYFSPLFCLLSVEDMTQDITVQIKGSWRFLNITHMCINKNKQKTHFSHSFDFVATTVWNNLPDDV